MALSGWTYRQSHIITSSSILSDYQLQFTVYKTIGTSSGSNIYCNNHCNDDFSDIRFTDISDNVYSYWIESYTSGVSAKIWVKFTSLSTSNTIYVYYGNSSAVSLSSGDNTFTLFDDFTSGTLNPSLWTTPTSYSISDGVLTLNTSSNESGALFSQSTIDVTTNILRCKHKVSSVGVNNRVLFGINTAKQSHTSGTYQATFEFYGSAAQLMTIRQGYGMTNSDTFPT